jgi:hypothetical protein
MAVRRARPEQQLQKAVLDHLRWRAVPPMTGTDFLKPLKLGSNVAEKLVARLSEHRHDLLNGKQLGTAGCYRHKLLA